MSPAAPELTCQKALAMQRALIAQYSRPEFQKQLRAALSEVGHDFRERMQVRRHLCMTVQAPILAKCGFESSAAGVAQSFAAFVRSPFADDPQIRANNSMIALLVNPELQDERDAKTEEDKGLRCP